MGFEQTNEALFEYKTKIINIAHLLVIYPVK